MHARSLEQTEYNQPTLALGGSCGYTINDSRVTIDIDAIRNDRPIGDISGTVAIELWALAQPYDGGDFSGVPLAATSIGEIQGQHLIPGCRYDLLFQAPPQGEWHLVLMLREWTALGYVTRDHVQFALPYRVAPSTPVVRKETDNVINVDFDPAKRQDVVEESRKIKIEPETPVRPQPKDEAPASAPPKAETPEPASPRAEKPTTAPVKAKVKTEPETPVRPQPKDEVSASAQPKAETPKPARPWAEKPATTPVKAEAESPHVTARTTPKATSVSVNQASHAEIAAVKGISRKVAENIVASRPFESLEDLLRVHGVGARLLAKVRAFLKT